MGRDKALLPWQGRPLLDHMLALLAAAGVERSVVSGDRPDHHGLPDRYPGQGPLGGLATAVAVLPDCRLLVVPVDMPRLAPARLVDLLRASPQAACLHFFGQPMPMHLRVDAALRELLAGWLADPAGPRSVVALQAALVARTLASADLDPGQFDNLNTPQDWPTPPARCR
ncbi:MAG: molybdenum cofactor guanylyltransferase [Xanthomonadales bacterium]|nr:molybdenum cofactor guanylyltransferase [Xanthomonadales bacterium]